MGSLWSTDNRGKITLIMPCLNNAALFQVAATTAKMLDEKIKFAGLGDDESSRLRALFSEGAMNAADIMTKLLAIAPFMEAVAKKWQAMPVFNLTGVGIAIAHADVKRTSGEIAPLAIWLSEPIGEV